jgi:AraC family transcriptional regulator of adaptative response/methylated-DNA-[protein]-cysteine methyltransferase
VQKMDADSQPLLQPWAEALRRHLAGDLQTFSGLPLDIAGTAFQAKVWKFLRTIPAGETRTYAEVAAGIGQSTSVRAVARACASNRIAVLIPCHRVLRGSGEMAGYRWGIERKIALIRLEKN